MSYRSNYKQLGAYIQQVNERNTDLKVERLLGVSIRKVLMPSIANTVGTNMKSYKIIKKNQFAYGPVTSRNGEKISVALLQEYKQAIVSQAYTVFEIINTEELDPEYLMMWFRRPEFDRYARYKSHGSARETFDWDEMCETELPIPSIEKQRQIVAEYNAVDNRIRINEQLNQKLEETAQAIYKHWFVDFEFPYVTSSGVEMPYKSSGGKLVYNEELDEEIPEGWEVDILNSMGLDISDGNYSSKYPRSTDFLNSGIPFIRGADFSNKVINPFSLNYISEKQHNELKKGHTKAGDILMATRGEIGKIAYITDDLINCNINAQLVRINGGENYSTFYLGCLFKSKAYKEELLSSTTGSALQQLPRKNLNATKFLKPPINLVSTFSEKYFYTHSYFIKSNQIIFKLHELKEILLSKMSKVEVEKEMV